MHAMKLMISDLDILRTTPDLDWNEGRSVTIDRSTKTNFGQ